MLCFNQDCEVLGQLLHGLGHDGRKGLGELILGGLDADERDLAAQLPLEEAGNDAERKGVGDGEAFFDALPVQPANAAWGQVHLGGIDHQDQIGLEMAQTAGEIFRRAADVQHQQIGISYRVG